MAIYADDSFVDTKRHYIRTEDLNLIGRMNGLGNYVRTRDAFMTIPRIPYEEWQKQKQNK